MDEQKCMQQRVTRVYPYDSSKPTRSRKRVETPTYKRAFTRREGCLLQYDHLFKDLPFHVIQTRFTYLSAHIRIVALKERIPPRQCFFRFKEPKALQLVYCNSDKSHPGYPKVQPTRISMLRINAQESEEISLHDVVAQGIINNELVAYFIGKVYEFYKCIGMNEKLQFKQQCDADAEYWVVEVECASGWIECTKIYAIIEDEKEARKMMAALDSENVYKLDVQTLGRYEIITPNMLLVTNEKKTVSTVNVAEVSFKIGLIICCLYEHACYIRGGSDESKQHIILRFPSLLAPFECFVIKNEKYKEATDCIIKSFDEAGLRYKIVTKGQTVRKSFIKSDECGCRFAIHPSSTGLVTIHERDNDQEISVKVNDVAPLIKDVLNEVRKWKNVYEEYIRDNDKAHGETRTLKLRPLPDWRI